MGKPKEKWLQEAIAEYEKRLSSAIHLQWVYPSSEKQLLKLLSEEKSWIALDSRGQMMDSIKWSQELFAQIEKNGSRLAFVIGAAEGLPPKVLQMAQSRWSLSPLTFTHHQTCLILIEQIYRSVEIFKKTPYHK